MAKKMSLGRGLDSIFGDNEIETKQNEVQKVRIGMIEPKADQPRQHFDNEALSQLADSIAAHGVLQPILVRPSSQAGFFQIIAGERRWRASKSQTEEGMEVDGGVRVDYLAELEKRATSLIGRRVGIQSGKRKKILSIEFQDDADLEELLTKLCGSEIIE